MSHDVTRNTSMFFVCMFRRNPHCRDLRFAVYLLPILVSRRAGDPLSGPSAVDAVAAGCVYLNPVYRTPFKKIYTSQHPFLEDSVGPPYVCSFPQRVSALNRATVAANLLAICVATGHLPNRPR